MRRKPYAVLLLDEFEKAHRDISNLLLQVLDEGFLTDAQGHRVDFRNTIIVMTTNLGADILVNTGANVDGDIGAKTKEAIMAVVSSSFAPEFLNRIDEVILFRRLSKLSLREIVDIRLRELQLRLDDRRIALSVNDEVREWLVQTSWDPRYGARPLNRNISKMIGYRLADKIIRGEIRNGQRACVSLREDLATLEVVLDNTSV